MFHCELAPVECFRGHAKRNCRINCDYSIHALRIAVPKYLSEVPLASIRCFFHKCWHLMQAYRLGAGFKLAQFMHQKFKTHRSLTEPRLNAIISELLEQGVAVDMLERAPSAPPAPVATSSAAGSSAAAPSVATSSAAPAAEAAGVEEEPDTDDAELQDHWALCNLWSKYRKLANTFTADEEFYCGHECCECPGSIDSIDTLTGKIKCR